jgi:hypothetical protein
VTWPGKRRAQFFEPKKLEQAGAELCQAQFKLGRTKPVLLFKFSIAFSVLRSEVVFHLPKNLGDLPFA